MDASRREEQVSVGADDTVRRTRTEPATSGDALELLDRADPPCWLWARPDGTCIAGAGAVREITGRGEQRIESILRQAETLFSRIEHDGPALVRPRLLGGIAFDPRGATSDAWEGFDPAWFYLPRTTVVETQHEAWVSVIPDQGASQSAGGNASPARRKPTDFGSSALPEIVAQEQYPSRSSWLAQVDSLCSQIAAGSLSKVVLAHSRQIAFDHAQRPSALVRGLRDTNPHCYVFAFRPSGSAVFAAATPERLVGRRGETINTDALAGSTSRGNDKREDLRLSNALEGSDKNRHEHELVVESIEQRLRSMGADVSIGGRSVRQLRSVQHLHTPIEAVHPGEPHVLELVAELHPTPAVGGLPREAALRAIETTEDFDRGWYAGPIGWFDAAGDGDFAIGIRSGIFRGKHARVFAGAGIVADSDPAREWEELQLKYRPILDTFADR